MRIPHRIFGALLLAASAGATPLAAQTARADSAAQGFFWGVLAGAGNGAASCEQFSMNLTKVLATMQDDQLKRFATGWADWWDDSYRWDLWGAAYIINGGASDDGFDYFRGWLLTQGFQQWERARRHPDTAFEELEPGTIAECEDVVVVLPNAYEARFHEEAPDLGAKEPTGTRWSESDLPRRFPTLTRRFGGSQAP